MTLESEVVSQDVGVVEAHSSRLSAFGLGTVCEGLPGGEI